MILEPMHSFIPSKWGLVAFGDDYFEDISLNSGEWFWQYLVNNLVCTEIISLQLMVNDEFRLDL